MPKSHLTSVADGNRSPSPNTLLPLIAQGDRDALGMLYSQLHGAIYGYAFSIVKNESDAQDILHDCFLAIVKNSGAYRDQGNAKAWIFTIAKNLCIQKLRDRQKADMPDWETWKTIPDRETESDDRLVVEACLQHLSEEERQIVVLHAVSGFRHREIASFLNLPLSTVLSKYNRSLKKLNKFLTEKEREQ